MIYYINYYKIDFLYDIENRLIAIIGILMWRIIFKGYIFIILVYIFVSCQLNLAEYKTIAYIEENFAREITSGEIEDIACYSYRNFQRVFMKLFGETLSGFQKRLRLENAYKNFFILLKNLVYCFGSRLL